MTAVAQVLAANADKVAEYKAGREKLFGFFVGQVMKAMAGKGNPGTGERGAEAGAVVDRNGQEPTKEQLRCRTL